MVDLAHTSKFKFGYHRSLDGLRGVAVMAVLTLHAYIPLTVAKDVKILGVGGFLGVDIFFVLSGFLITSLLIQEWEVNDRIDFKKFYARRALRLLPALYVFVAACVLYSILFQAKEESDGALSDVFAITFYLSNWIPINLYSLRHTWSLAVEEQFYLLYPILLGGILLVVKRLKIARQRIILFLLLLIAVIGIYRAVLFAHSGFSMRIYIGSDTRADSLLFGCLVGMIISANLIPQKLWFERLLKIAASGAAAALFYMFLTTKYDSSFFYYGGFTFVAFLVGLIIISLQVSPPKILKLFLEWSVLIWIGRLSYGIYLWHKLVYMIMDSALPLISIQSETMRRIILPLTIKIVCSLIVAAVSYYFVEKPFLRLKQRFTATSPVDRNLEEVISEKIEFLNPSLQAKHEAGNFVQIFLDEKTVKITD
jgi:peptidoglycan/LPS O-acetylase OafA/YrhL